MVRGLGCRTSVEGSNQKGDPMAIASSCQTGRLHHWSPLGVSSIPGWDRGGPRTHGVLILHFFPGSLGSI